MTKNLEGRGPVAGALLPWAGAALGLLLAVGLATAGEDAYDWPNWRGPYCNGTAADCGEPLVEALSEATVLWKSEETIPDTVIEHTPVSVGSGFCEPIIHQGRVYLHYFVPTGKPDERMARAVTKATQGRGVPPADIESTAKPQADHVVLCMDSLTGNTLWKTVFPEKSVNGNHVCWVYTLCAPKLDACAADGRIASISASGRIFCLRATDGKPLWESNIGPEAERAIMHLDAYVRNHEFMGSSRDAARHVGQMNYAFDLFRSAFTDFDSSPNIVDGVLVTSDYLNAGKPTRPGVRGFDMVTGRHLWTVPNCSGNVSTLPIRWRHAGKDYVISAHSDRVVCIDPKNGKELWEIVGKNIAQESIPAISGDYLVVDGAGTYQNPNGLGPTLTCYLMSPEKAEKVWSAPASVRAASFYGPTICQDWVYWRGAGVTCADLKTGKVIKSAPLGMATGMDAADGRLFSGTKMAFADPAKWGSTSPGGKNPIPANAVYGDSVVSNGRLYYRTRTNVVCLELRKTPKPVSTPAVAKPTVAESAPVTELVGLLVGDNWQLQLAAAKVLTARGAAAKSCCPDLVAGVAKAVTAGDQASASLLVKVIVAVDPSAIPAVVGATGKSLDSKDTLVLVAACAALREAGRKAEPTAKILVHLLATGDTQVTPAAADALAAIGPDATAALDTLFTVLSGKDEVKALQASRALMGIGVGAKGSTETIVEGFCAHPGPARYYLSETLRAIGPSTIPLLVQNTSAYMPVVSKVRGESKPGDAMLMLATAVALSHFGTAAKETTSYMEKILEAMGSGSNSNARYRIFIEDSLNMVNDRPVKRAFTSAKHGPKLYLGVDPDLAPSATTNTKGTEVDEP